jgi:hypothetical protein
MLAEVRWTLGGLSVVGVVRTMVSLGLAGWTWTRVMTATGQLFIVRPGRVFCE